MNRGGEETLADIIDAVLRNWGRWCGGSITRHMEYQQQPCFRHYVPPIPRQTKVRVPIFEDEAWDANQAVNQIAEDRGADDQVYMAMVGWYALRVRPASDLAKMLNCHRATLYRRLDRAKDLFWEKYQGILLEKSKNAG